MEFSATGQAVKAENEVGAQRRKSQNRLAQRRFREFIVIALQDTMLIPNRRKSEVTEACGLKTFGK